MATISYLVDRNSPMVNHSSGVTETDNSSASMTKAVEVNIDKAKITSKADIIEALQLCIKTIMESSVLTGA